MVGQRRTRTHVQPDIGVKADLVADVAAWHRAAAGQGDILDQQGRQSGAARLPTEPFQMGDGLRGAPERAAIQMDGLEARPSGGRLTAPAMQPPVLGPPIMCSGPGAGPLEPATAAAADDRMKATSRQYFKICARRS